MTFEGRPVTVQAAEGSALDKVLSTTQKHMMSMWDLTEDKDFMKTVDSCDTSTREDQVKLVEAFEKICVTNLSVFPMPKHDNVTKTVFGKEDGLPCEVTIIAPADQKGPLPGMVHIHGGGMAFFDGKEPFNTAGSEKMASKGKAVFCEVHFTNSTEETFPRGFNDCVAAIRWFHERQEQFNLIRDAGVMVSGESGGANLAAAACLKLKGEGIVAAAVLGCPYLKPTMYLEKNLPYTQDEINAFHLFHMKEEYLNKFTEAVQKLYTNSEEDNKNVFAWPGFAADEDVKGLPPTLFMLDEGDALTSEGLEYFRKLDRNGVTASAVTFAGSSHGMFAIDPLHADIAEAYYCSLARRYCKPKETPEKEKEAESDSGEKQN